LLKFLIQGTRFALVSAIVSMLLACANSLDDSLSAEAVGSVRRLTPDRYRILVGGMQGWRIWQTYFKGEKACLAVKPAVGETWPNFIENIVIAGGKGFAMRIVDRSEVPSFSFYGEYPGAADRVRINGETLEYIDDAATVLVWDGRTLSFEVNSEPLPEKGGLQERLQSNEPLLEGSYGLPQKRFPTPQGGSYVQQGEVDFSGLRDAYQARLACHVDLK